MKDIVGTVTLAAGVFALGIAFGIYIGQDSCARPVQPLAHHTRAMT